MVHLLQTNHFHLLEVVPISTYGEFTTTVEFVAGVNLLAVATVFGLLIIATDWDLGELTDWDLAELTDCDRGELKGVLAPVFFHLVPEVEKIVKDNQ